VPVGVWWLLAAVLIGLAIAIPLLVRSRRRKAWQSDFGGAVDEVTWLARELVPELGRTGSRAQAAGGWAVSAERTRLLQERLTALEATAPDDASRAHARTLHDAVHAARQSLRELDSDRTDASLAPQLASITTDLEFALRSVGSRPSPPAA
jgi:hypothetical protein